MKVFREITHLGKDDVFVIKSHPNARFEYPLHMHPEFELTLITKAAGKRIIGDSIEEYEGPDLVLIGPEVYHKWDDEALPAHKKNKAHSIVLHFEPSLFTENLLCKQAFYPIKSLLQQSRRGIYFDGVTRKKVELKMHRLCRLSGLDAVLEFLSILQLLATSEEKRLLASEGFDIQVQSFQNQRIDDVCNYLRKHFRERVQIATVAKIANMSESAFSHFFKKSTCKSFTRYLIDLRLSHACKLLLETRNPVSQICYNCGFNNLSNFNRLFKKYKGMTPFDYRNQYEQQQSSDKRLPSFLPLQMIS
ncbi:MAG: AraC family transcriptional regulator [Bacteroidota bacterium]